MNGLASIRAVIYKDEDLQLWVVKVPVLVKMLITSKNICSEKYETTYRHTFDAAKEAYIEWYDFIRKPGNICFDAFDDDRDDDSLILECWIRGYDPNA